MRQRINTVLTVLYASAFAKIISIWVHPLLCLSVCMPHISASSHQSHPQGTRQPPRGKAISVFFSLSVLVYFAVDIVFFISVQRKIHLSFSVFLLDVRSLTQRENFSLMMTTKTSQRIKPDRISLKM
jgi:hypothetical protein